LKRFLIPVLILTAVNAVAAGRGRVIRTPHGTPSVWTAPNCTTTYGLPGFYFTRDEGRTVSLNPHPRPVNSGVLVVVTDVPNRMFALFGDGLYDSVDAGCNWSLRSRLPLQPVSTLTAAPGGRAYGWSYADGRILRISASSFDVVEASGRVMGFGVDPADAQHVVAVTQAKIQESFDGGSNWSDREVFAFPMIETAAVDPTDVRHIAISYVATVGAVPRVEVTRDGGITWQRAPEGVRAWKLAFSPADPNAIWMTGRAWPPVGAAPLNAYQSADGGKTFDCLAPPSTLYFNNLTLAPSPADAHVAAQASSFGGLAIIDAASKAIRFAPANSEWISVTWSPVPGVIYLTSSDSVIIN